MYTKLVTPAGQETFAISYPNRGDNTGRRLVMLGHGVNALGEVWFSNVLLNKFVTNLCEKKGMCVIAPDLAGTIPWGNDAARNAFTAAWTWAKANLGIKNDKLCSVGWSMGNIAQSTWAADNKAQVAALVGLTPAADVKAIRDANRNGYAASINTAYGGAGAFDAARAARDPAPRAAELNGLPLKVYRASDDPICLPAEVNAFNAAAGGALVDLGAVGHSIVTVDFNDVANFLAQYA